MRTLNDVMRAARHPKGTEWHGVARVDESAVELGRESAGAVQLKLREIERGTFSAPASEPKPRRPGIPDVSYRLISSHIVSYRLMSLSQSELSEGFRRGKQG